MANKGKPLRVQVKPEMIRWAMKRAGRSLESLYKSFPNIAKWEAGEVQPTLKQLERLARTLHVPLGYFFLDTPPDEPLPIPDFRTMQTRKIGPPSPELLDTIYLCQQIQDWYRDFMITNGEKSLAYVGSVTVSDEVKTVAEIIRRKLNFDVDERREMRTWTQAFFQFIEQTEQIGILVMVNSVVGNNTHRQLNPEEFRGFALVDEYAPLIFINGADTISARMFTLAHELVHIWAGKTGISDSEIYRAPENGFERWCNAVAAEILVPENFLHTEYNPDQDIHREINRLARIFKVSTLVILRRLYDAGYLKWDDYTQLYHAELSYIQALEKRRKKMGGDFYSTLMRRVSPRFARALISSVYEEHTLFRDAFRLLGLSKMESFKKFAKVLK